MVITIYQKLSIGAIGAVCVSILKLINANFYLGSSRSEAIGAYLTFFGYVVLGMALGGLFWEDREVAQKTRKSAFLMGLLAPSILLAIIAKPPSIGGAIGTDGGKIPAVKSWIMDKLIPSVYAQEPHPDATQPTPPGVL